MSYPIDAVIAVTYRCQSRCTMCSIWRIKEHHDVPPEVYRKLPNTLRDVNLSGGEPFLRKDLAVIVRVVHGHLPRARIVVSSNGFLGKAIVPRALELREIFPKIGFAFSIDGVGEKHDQIRGIPGGFEKTTSVVRTLRKEGVKNMRIAYTLTTQNADQMTKVHELANELDVQFTMSLSHDSEFYFGKHGSTIMTRSARQVGSEKLRDDFTKVIRNELASSYWKRWGRAFGIYGIYRVITDGEPLFYSRPGVDYFYLDPTGDVYPSVLHNYVMGNITKDDFATVWNSQMADDARRKSREENRPYWMGCMLRKALLDHRFEIGMWVLQNKLLGFKIQN
jgi:MoaA/NifB/PqqE/SkfB family radical SAM enzyme